VNATTLSAIKNAMIQEDSMSGIWTKRTQLIGRTSEIIGYKSGLGLNREELNDIIPKHFHNVWFGEDNILIRIRSEEYEELISHLLYEIGNIPSPSNAPASIVLYKKYRDDPEMLDLYNKLMSMFIKFMRQSTKSIRNEPIDVTPFIKEAEEKLGVNGLMMAIELVDSTIQQLHRSPWGKIRQIEWSDIAELKELFESESLKTMYGKFIDQRYIDFLSHNFDLINNINWRKFEALTCEYFDRQGYQVEIGEGRDDDGIDARVWTDQEDCSGPPTMLIQCKRYKNKIEKMVVKSLWADIIEYNAQSGLIVTTSSLSPGAETVCTARNYPITQANRDTLRKWIDVMRTPYKGVFLAE
jgi:restriction system protein